MFCSKLQKPSLFRIFTFDFIYSLIYIQYYLQCGAVLMCSEFIWQICGWSTSEIYSYISHRNKVRQWINCYHLYHNFERTEIRATVFLKWTDFSTCNSIDKIVLKHTAYTMFLGEHFGNYCTYHKELLTFNCPFMHHMCAIKSKFSTNRKGVLWILLSESCFLIGQN